MKYRIRVESGADDSDFQINELRIVREKSRGLIATLVVGGWLLLMLLAGAEAAVTGHRRDMYWILITITQQAGVACYWYFAREHYSETNNAYSTRTSSSVYGAPCPTQAEDGIRDVLR